MWNVLVLHIADLFVSVPLIYKVVCWKVLTLSCNTDCIVDAVVDHRGGLKSLLGVKFIFFSVAVLSFQHVQIHLSISHLLESCYVLCFAILSSTAIFSTQLCPLIFDIIFVYHVPIIKQHLSLSIIKTQGY